MPGGEKHVVELEEGTIIHSGDELVELQVTEEPAEGFTTAGEVEGV